MTNTLNRYEAIGSRIREARERAGLLQQDLAVAVGFESATAISLIEKGLRKVSIPYLDKIAETLHTTTIELLGEGEIVQSDPISTVRFALRADKELSKQDEEKVMDFYSFIKNKRAGNVSRS
jgi:transcriptional regulator with XRE-family HTH domain